MHAAGSPSEIKGTPRALRPDRLTLIAVSALAYVVGVALHEHLGHATACVLLGGHVAEMGAFYVNCAYVGMGAWSVRAVAIAGPLVSALTGAVAFGFLRRIRGDAPTAFFFTWLLGSLGLMSAAGYLLFSGISGIGDLGGGPDGALRGATPLWAWRVALTVLGGAAYWWVVRLSARRMDERVSGAGRDRIRAARLTALDSYLTGVVVFTAIGALNPHGLVIVATSAVASSAGGSSGLLWMMQLLDRRRAVGGPGIAFGRSWRWIGAAAVGVLAYAAVFGPTLRR
ncbi:MAG: hypothetical protein KGL38_08035 [Gemmatimonadota bacterium]|nr:hypothetical protein [Gemmatimonadota bacterium]